MVRSHSPREDWAGRLHAFFAAERYHLAWARYGSGASGYMGTALAWPQGPDSAVRLVDLDMWRVGDGIPAAPAVWGRPVRKMLGLLDEAHEAALRPLTSLFGLATRPTV